MLIVIVAGWVQRHQQQAIAYLIEENRLLTRQLSGHRLRLTDTERAALLRWLIPSLANASKL